MAMTNTLKFAFLAGLIIAAGLQASPSFAFDASGGDLSGLPGATIGWGFTLTEPGPAEFLLISESAFCPVTAVQSDLPAGCAADFASLGSYTDFSTNIPIVGPAPDTSPLTVNFDSPTQAGFGSFVIDPGAGVGTTTGEIAIIYDLFTGDPNTDPSATQIGGDNFTTLAASITVQSATPEPASWWCAGIGLIVLMIRVRRARS